MINESYSMNDIPPFVSAERHVEKVLLSYGHIILARNYRVPRLGEIDLISLHKGKVYAVEVKARQVTDRYGAESRFTAAKQQKVIKTLYRYLSDQHQTDRELGLLAAEIYWDRDFVIRDCSIHEWEI